MSNNVDLYIQELETTKVEIKNAIIAKGVTPEGGLSSYADAINSIESSIFETETLSVELSENGTYNYTPTVDGYSSVEVTVDVPEPDLRQLNLSVTENGSYEYDTPDNIDGYNKVNLTVEVAGSGDGGKPKILNGFIINGIRYDDRRHSTNLAYLDFSQYDWSGVYDLSYFFGNYYNSTSYLRWGAADFVSFVENFNGRILACENMFQPSTGNRGLLSYIPSNLINKFNNCLSFKKLFASNRNFTSANGLENCNTSNVVSTQSMFEGCTELTDVPAFDTSNVVDMSKMFQSCSSLTDVPAFDTSNVYNMSGMFYSCSILTSIPLFDTSNVTTMKEMFSGCNNLTEAPELDMSNVIDVQQMFSNCKSLKIVPNMNTSKLRNFISNTTDSGPFSGAINIEKIGTIDCSSIQNFNYLFRANMNKLTDFGGCINLGKMANITGTNTNYSLYYAPNLNYESVLNIVNSLYDRASAGYPIVTLKLHPNHLAKLSDEEKAIATNKGWTLA